MNIVLKAWIIHPSYHSVSSNMRPYMNPPCHNHCTDTPLCERQLYASSREHLCTFFRRNHCIDISPCERQPYASSGELLCQLLSTLIALTFPPVRDNRMPLQGSLCVNFLGAIIALTSPLWETIVCLFRGAFFCEFLMRNPHTQNCI